MTKPNRVVIRQHTDGRTFSFACQDCNFRRRYMSEQTALTSAIGHMGDVHSVRVTLPRSDDQAIPDYCVDCGVNLATTFYEDPLCENCYSNRLIAREEMLADMRIEAGLTRWSETGTSRRTR